MEFLILGVVAVALIVALSTIGSKLRIAPPLILIVVGVVVGFLPSVPIVAIPPELILAGVLPPLLYSAAMAMPTVEFRRDLVAIGGLSVILVVISSIVIGFVVSAIIPGVNLSLGIALGAILSPTDAVATSIVKRLGVPRRIITVLEGESLLNDATALVLLRSALAATTVGLSFWPVAVDFLRAAGIAIVIGAVVGWAGIHVRRHIVNGAATTVVSFLVPFVAYIPSEELHASGLVAVVAAGIMSRQLAPHHLSARHRMAERANWHTVEFLLEGGVFLAMGLEVSGLVEDLYASNGHIGMAFGIAGIGILLATSIRGLFVSGLIWLLGHSANKKLQRRKAIATMGERFGIDAGDPQSWSKAKELAIQASKHAMDGRFDHIAQLPAGAADAERFEEIRQRLAERRHHELERRRKKANRAGPERTAERTKKMFERARVQVTRYVADVDYLIREAMGAKEGVLLTWAGMRGVVTLAAAQTLPLGTPNRSLLILIAFLVAAGSLLLQGATLPWVSRSLGLVGKDNIPPGEREKLDNELDAAALDAINDPELNDPNGNEFDPRLLKLVSDRISTHAAASSLFKAKAAEDTEPEVALEVEDALVGSDESDDELHRQIPMLWLEMIHAKREALLEASALGTYSSGTLTDALAELDADEIGMQLRIERDDD